MKNAIVLVVDRLGAGYLGPYGNTWIDTPNFNRLAAESLLFEFVMADSPHLPLLYRSYWKGLHAISDDAAGDSLPESLVATDIHTAVVTDDQTVAELKWTDAFDERIALSPTPAVQTAEEVGLTQMAHLFASVVDWLAKAPEPFLLWVHSRGMAGSWDSPLDFRNQFADEEDPTPPDTVTPPVMRLETDYDPDDLLGLQHAYAGQVRLLDMCLGVLLDAVYTMPAGEATLLAVTSPRGYPLGEHGRVGQCDDTLYGELLNVPCFLRFPDGVGAAARSHYLVQPPDVFSTLLDWLGLPACDESVWGTSLIPALDDVLPSHRDRACSISEGHSAIRTPAWLLQRHPESKRELFAKPGDRWEANEVADRCGETANELETLLEEFREAVRSGDVTRLTPLSKVLVEGLE
jgi:arylsulfatase A-like enzyme